ncbi:MAG: DUF5704 domain-containing protein [Paenibacillus sp.]|nr:DUF5704 domain-containing protein [Paenibacillus sp.]
MKNPNLVTLDAQPTVGTPGVYWYQLDEGNFKADHNSGPTFANNVGSCSNPYPAATEVPDRIDFSLWPATDWNSYNGNPVTSLNVKNLRIKSVTYQSRSKQDSYQGVGTPTITSGSTIVGIRTITGGNNTPTNSYPFENGGKTDAGCKKFSVVYYTPMDIIWQGDLEEQKEIDVNPDSTIKVGEKKQIKAQVRTIGYGSTQWGQYVDVSNRTSEVKWFSSDTSIFEVSDTGVITGKKAGKGTVRAIWNNGTYLISDTAQVTVTAQPGLVISLPPKVCTTNTTPQQAEVILTKPDMTTVKLTAHPKLSWSSSNPSVATIGADGMITPKGLVGTTQIKAHFKDDTQSIDATDTKTLTVEDCSGGSDPGNPGDGGGGGCSYVIESPSQGIISSGAKMDPSANGVLKADHRGAEIFDVLKGIPTSESLYANVFGFNYLFQNKWANMRGQVTYSVPVTKTYHKTWTIPGVPGKPPIPPKPMSSDETVTETKTVTRNYSYWQIDNLEIYKIRNATVSNYALGGYGGTVTLNPNGYTPPTLISDNKEDVNTHVHPAPCSSIDLGTENVPGGSSEPPTPNDSALFQSAAESEVKPARVNNDNVVFNGNKIMDNIQVETTAPTPGVIPQPITIGQNVLYQSGYTVSKTLVNKANNPTTGIIYYDLLPGNIKGGSDKDFNINGMNTVTVHTPVVIYASISDDRTHNQKTKPAANRDATILDRPFTIYMPTSGQHLNIPGYGNRDYAKYMKDKQVWFPFDVYSGDKSKFYPKNNWISIPVNQEATTFFLPVWVDEGFYDVLFRTIAENAPTNFTTQPQANLDLANHVATDIVPVDVIGRVYDFRVTDIADPNWETVFRTAKGGSTPKGTSYWVGLNGIDGAKNGTSFPYVLPILRGSHPLANYKSVAVKTGYHFKFDLKSKGNMFGDSDAIRITPTFYFQDNDPSTPVNRIPVDLYYHSDTKKFIKVGSAADVERRGIILNNRLRNVPYADIVNTAGSIYDLKTGWPMTRDQYMNSFVKRSTEPTYVGGYDIQVLTSPLRTFINTSNRPSNASATPARVNASIQQWYGEYSLPAAVYVVRKGADLAAYGKTNKLDEKSPIFLKNGYITVNFDIETIRNADFKNPYLQYIHGPLDNQWWDMEGFDSADGSRDHMITDPYGVKYKIEDGDVIFYNAKHSSYDDFTTNGTH